MLKHSWNSYGIKGRISAHEYSIPIILFDFALSLVLRVDANIVTSNIPSQLQKVYVLVSYLLISYILPFRSRGI